MTDEIRYWPRLGLYVSRADAEEYILKSGGAGSLLNEDLEEFVPTSPVPAEVLRMEVEDLFSKPFVHVELSSENNTILAALEMEKSRPARVKELKAEGHTTEEAKEIFQRELDAIVRQALDLPDETEQERIYRERAKAIQDGEEDPAYTTDGV